METLREFIEIVTSAFNNHALFGLLTGALVTFVATKIIDRSKARKEYEKERFDNLYNAFIVLRDKIHKGAAYDFSHLSKSHQVELINLLTQNTSYTDEHLNMCIYMIKTSENHDEIDQLYNTITELVYYEYDRIRRKIYWNKLARVQYNYRNKKYKSNMMKKNQKQQEHAAKKLFYIDY